MAIIIAILVAAGVVAVGAFFDGNAAGSLIETGTYLPVMPVIAALVAGVAVYNLVQAREENRQLRTEMDDLEVNLKNTHEEQVRVLNNDHERVIRDMTMTFTRQSTDQQRAFTEATQLMLGQLQEISRQALDTQHTQFEQFERMHATSTDQTISLTTLIERNVSATDAMVNIFQEAAGFRPSLMDDIIVGEPIEPDETHTEHPDMRPANEE